jgi:hypothetical protein
MKTKLTSLDVARRIANGKCPLDILDHVLVGELTRRAVEDGFIRHNYGCNDDWGGYSVTDKGRKALEG